MGKNLRGRGRAWIRAGASAGAAVLFALLLARASLAGPALGMPGISGAESFTAAAPAPPLPGTPQPRYRWGTDLPVVGLAAGLGLAALAVPTDRDPVPSGGLDPSRIWPAFDRQAVKAVRSAPGASSTRMMAAAVAYPWLLSFAWAPPGRRVASTLRRVPLYLEASLLSDALTGLLKRSVSRPRPFLYDRSWTGSDWPAPGHFQSFPSGHVERAYCSSAFAVADHLLSRPQASGWEQAAAGFVGGILAGATGELRIKAGQHFPSDVAAAALIGSACGAGVPLLHGYLVEGRPAARPTAWRWLDAAGGMILGSACGILLAR
jgi:membrane-associated phospholipid phosphatase